MYMNVLRSLAATALCRRERMKGIMQIKRSLALSAQKDRWQEAILALVTIIGIGLYVVLDVVAQVLPPHYNPVSQAESDLAVGPYGFIMAINFVIRGLLSFALLAGLMRATKAENRSQTGMVLLGIWAACAVLLAFFPTDLAGAHPTLHGVIHLLLAFIAFVCGVVEELLLSLRFANDEQWRSLRNPGIAIAIVALIVGILLFAAPFTGARVLTHTGGLLERIFLGLVLLWLLVVALRLLQDGPVNRRWAR